ncbi:MAG: EscU/YscU/HrcU family type III secretion system export apparatus switch protein [Vallitaleaceae bacterium]|jgi:flagellar biosynthesis protein|nr:EscU/YscU/HrcU family type III secretion system export apparatus switch protein [Vallitaleaceae bacterium]
MNKKIKKAAAITYDITDDAPKVVAKGKGIIADNIIEKGELYDVPIYQDSDLVDTLTKFDIGDYIPPELYQVVAEVMVFVSNLDKLQDNIK